MSEFKASLHTHAESYLTGSTLKNLIKRAKALGRTHFTYTDHGHMSSALKAYGMAKKEGMKFIPGVEVYFKDTACDLVNGTEADRCKYFSITLYATDQEKFQGLSQLVSRSGRPTISIFDEDQQLWNWNDLAEAGQLGLEAVLSGVHCMVGKVYLAGRPDTAQNVLLKLKGMFQDHLHVGLLAEPWAKKWHSVMKITLTDGTSISCLASDYIQTDKARRMPASDLIEKTYHKVLINVQSPGSFQNVGKGIVKATLHKGFLPLPGGDAAVKVNAFLFALATRHQLPVMVTDYAYYANREDKVVQTMKLEGDNKMHSNLHMKSTDEIKSYFTSTMGFSEDKIAQILSQNDSFAQKFDSLNLKYDWRLADPGGDALAMAIEIIKANGRMKWDDPKWKEQLKKEIMVFNKNGVFDFMPYFLPIRDVMNFYTENGQLIGPGRGSAGASLLVYLLGITQIDPFEFELPFERFFSMARVRTKKLPDIDVDLEDRELLVGPDGKSGYLYGRWGDKAAQISTRTTMRLKSAILDTNRFFHGKVEDEIKVFAAGLPTPPQGVTDSQFVFGFEDDEGTHHDGLFEISDSLKEYAAKRPLEWEIVSKAMGITRSFSQHASAFVLADKPIQSIVPTKDGHIAQYEAKECESAGLIKYDFLVVKQLRDIRVALDLINKKNGRISTPDDVVGWWHSESDSGACFDCEDTVKVLSANADAGNEPIDVVHRKNARPEMICYECRKPLSKANKTYQVGYFDHNGEKTYIYKLPQDKEVFQSVWTGATETCFQINSRSMTPFTMEMLPETMGDIAAVLALIRPGPLDMIDELTGRNMAEEYLERRKGNSQPDIPELAEILPKTYGILAYQEDLGKIAKKLAGFSDEEAELLRENMAKKKMVELMKMKPQFIDGAKQNVKLETAEKIWEMMVTFGRYGFSIIHAVEYAHITYACMFLKHHYPLEWWASVLTNADEKEITGTLWPFVKHLVMPPDINLSGDQMAVDYANGKIRAKLGVIRGMGEKTIDPIVAGRPYRDIQDFVNKEVAGESTTCKLINVGILDSLFPPNLSTLDKLQMFVDAVEIKAFNDKVEETKVTGAKMRAKEPKKGKIPENYLNLTPLQDIVMKKAVWPTMPIDLHELGANHSTVLIKDTSRPMVMSGTHHETRLVTGSDLEKIDAIDGQDLQKDIYMAATCFVINAKEFTYANDTKKALKITLDADGYISEKVLWPEYESGKLVYPAETKKGAIATVFFRKRAGKKDTSAIRQIVIEG